jgi:hypothetical protein
MPKFMLRSILLLFGGLIAAQIVEYALTSRRGQQLAHEAGLDDLTSFRGVEMAQKYARALVNVIVGAFVAVQEYLDSRSPEQAGLGWPERVQVSAQILLAVGSIAKTVSDFLEERRKLVFRNA